MCVKTQSYLFKKTFHFLHSGPNSYETG